MPPYAYSAFYMAFRLQLLDWRLDFALGSATTCSDISHLLPRHSASSAAWPTLPYTPAWKNSCHTALHTALPSFLSFPAFSLAYYSYLPFAQHIHYCPPAHTLLHPAADCIPNCAHTIHTTCTFTRISHGACVAPALVFVLFLCGLRCAPPVSSRISGFWIGRFCRILRYTATHATAWMQRTFYRTYTLPFAPTSYIRTTGDYVTLRLGGCQLV